MDELPPEVSLLIFQVVPKSDLKSLRLVSKKINMLATKFLFTRVYASLHHEDLDVLHAIARHPTLSTLVKEIVYSGVYFHMYEIGPEDEFLQHKDDPGRQYYLAHVEQQEEMLKQRHHDEVIIFIALSLMPNIRRVTLTNHWCPTRDLLGTGYSIPGYAKPPRDVKVGGPLSRAYPPSAKEPSGLPLQRGLRKHCRMNIDYGFRVMYRAMNLARPSIQELSVDYYDDPCRSDRLLTRGISPRSLLFSPLDLKNCCTAFSQLRKIAFSLCPASTDDEWDILMEGNLAAVLAAATELEELTFDFTCSSNDVPLEKCLGTHVWPQLRSIRLLHKEMSSDELVALLKRHCKTLKVLCLDSCHLYDGTWASAAEEMCQWLALESATFHYLIERDGLYRQMILCDQLEKYVLSREWHSIYDENYRPQTPTT
ncbi:F-box domain, Skp2-like protein [Metarhizium rileyi]|uniref:F-box domain, Skp2-like protein n=1 Tax=Metarhizium rileyi (strain RCEF 4871) TaxID=1649241 RepID=A0A166W074_METRR|nr:F-box domain, Skp2-like protein [Metarhizium rileyi RCEF 4871]